MKVNNQLYSLLTTSVSATSARVLDVRQSAVSCADRLSDLAEGIGATTLPSKSQRPGTLSMAKLGEKSQPLVGKEKRNSLHIA